MSDFVVREGELSFRKSAAWLYPDGNYPEWAKKEGLILEKYIGKDADVTIPDGIDEISEEAFLKNKFIKTLNITESVYDLGIKSFYGCSNLKRMIIRGTIHCWTDFITKKQDVELVFLKNSLDNVDVPYQEKALRGFIYAVENGIQIDENIREENISWIKRRRKRLYPKATENLSLLRLMLDNKIIPQKELDDILNMATGSGSVEAAAIIIQYTQAK